MTCPIWGTPAQSTPSGDAVDVHSNRAGGAFRVAGTAWPALEILQPDVRARLTTWIVDEHRSGVELPIVNLEVLRRVRDRSSISLAERKERFFKAIKSISPGLDLAIKLGGQVDDDYRRCRNLFGSWTESTTADSADLPRLCDLLEQDGFVSTRNYHVFLTSAGWSYLEGLNRSGADSNQAFVAMWFDAQMSEAYEEGLAPALRDAGYIPVRIDRKEHNNKIDDEIIAEIRLSKFVVADFTSGAFEMNGNVVHIPRGGVYYEAGYARGLGMDVIACVRDDQIGQVHFDTRQISHVLWSTAAELRERLYNRIIATIGAASNAPGRGQG